MVICYNEYDFFLTFSILLEFQKQPFEKGVYHAAVNRKHYVLQE